MHKQSSREGAMSGISIVTEDRYLNGLAQFIIIGMENVKLDQWNTLSEIRTQVNDDNTMNVMSTTSGLTGQTGNTVYKRTTQGNDTGYKI